MRSLLPLSLIALCALGFSAESAPGPAGVVELPRFVVTDSRELPAPEAWRYAALPGLEILSSLPDDRTQVFARNFQLSQHVLEIVWPALSREAPGGAVSLVLCGRDDLFPSFRPAREAGSATSLFLQEDERVAIVVDYVRERFDDRPGALASAANLDAEPDPAADPVAAGMAENDPFREFYQQYYRFVLRRGGGFVPPWLEEGLVQLLASVDYSSRSVALGRLQDGAGGQRSEEFHVQLTRRPLMDVGRMLAAQKPPAADAPVYSAQCYAFIHLCLFGKRGTLQPALTKLAQRAAQGPITEKIFRECFGLGFDEMGVLLRSHATYAAHQYVEYRAGKKEAGFRAAVPVTLRAATQAEVGRIKGEAYQLAGHTHRARTELIAPYIRGARDARLLGALGLHERRRGEAERARTLLEAAMAAHVDQPRVALELSRLRFTAAKASAANGQLNRDEAQSILAPLVVSLQHPPLLPETFELMAETWAISAVPPSATDLVRIYAGAKRFPTRLRLVYLAAALAARHDPANARPLIEHGLAVAKDAEVAKHFRALQVQLK